MKKISVIVPVFKIEEKLLRACMESLCRQTYANSEFIVVDDGSPDNCGVICDEYRFRDKRINVIHTDNMGVSNARNVGIENSEGQYIMFLDGDDYLEPDACEKAVTKMEETNVDLLLFMYTNDENNTKLDNSYKVQKLGKKDIQNILKNIISHEEDYAGFFTGALWSKVLKREIIDKFKLKSVVGLTKCQDRVFLYDYVLHISTAALYYYCGYHYVDNVTSITRKYNKNIKFILRNVQNEFIKRISEVNGNKDDLYHAFNDMNLSFFSVILTLDILNAENNDSFSKKAKDIRLLSKEKYYNNALRCGNYKVLGKRKTLILKLIRMRLYHLAVILGKKVL